MNLINGLIIGAGSIITVIVGKIIIKKIGYAKLERQLDERRRNPKEGDYDYVSKTN